MREQRIIIFDSPDGTGKSNIAQGLSMRTGIPYFKMNTEHMNWHLKRFRDALEFDQPYLVQLLKQSGYSLIIDRAYPAEWVYSKVYDRDTNDILLKDIDLMHADLGTTIVIPLRRDYSKNRKDEVVDNAMLPKIHDKYLEFARWTACKTVKVYVDDFNDNLISELDYIMPLLDMSTSGTL